jgi:predicted nuclease of predicted toxin-antitoxin system
LQQSLYELTDHPVVLYVRSKPEVVVTKNGNISFEKLKEQMLQQLKKMHADQLESISKETL